MIETIMNYAAVGGLNFKADHDPREILLLWEKYLSKLDNRTLFLEIGAKHGGSSMLWLKLGFKEGIILDHNIEQFQYEDDRLTLIQGNSHDKSSFGAVFRKLRTRRVDFLYIDGDHTSEGCLADFENYKCLVKPGGIIGIHDIKLPGPKRCIDLGAIKLDDSLIVGHNGIGVVKYEG